MKKIIFWIIFGLLLVSCNNQQDEGKTMTGEIDGINNEEEATVWTMETNNEDTSQESGNKMTFFVTSKNPWNWANFWWIEWADSYCQELATNAGRWDLSWKAYLSATMTWWVNINARDRIGNWPWYNAKWVLIASNIDELHQNNNINKETALDENWVEVLWRWDSVNNHDILTWTMSDWTASGSTVDTTCNNWTSSWSWSAIVGHHDRMWLDDSDSAKSWNSSHLTRGCDLESLRSTWWWWLLYCFAG